MPAGRVLIAPGNPLAATPAWARYDELPNCRCQGWDISSGRASVFEITDVGTATVHFQDRNRTLDTNSLVGRAIQLQILDPVTGVWEPSWRGVIDEPTFDVYPLTAGLVSTVQLQCVDMFAYLGRVEMLPGVHGELPVPHGKEGSIVYESQRVDDRIKKLFLDARVPDPMFVVFTGNVDVWDTDYDPGESFLTALRDAADAEFPGVANILCDRRGRVCFHGRRSRFDPEAVVPGGDWTFTRWDAGDGTATAAGAAQIRELSYTRASSLIYNVAQAWPKFLPGTKPNTSRLFPEGDKPGQVYTDFPSRDDYGYRAMPPMADLLVRENFNNGNDGPLECRLYAQYFVENYKVPHRIPVVTIKSVRPEDPRAAATWALLTRIEISDTLRLLVGAAGMAWDEYFVEGFTKTVRVLTPGYDLVELTPNLSSVARYTTDPGLND